MTPTSTPATAAAGAAATVAGIGPGTASASQATPQLASSYAVTGPTDLKQYLGKRVQVVGVVLSPRVAQAGGGQPSTNGSQMAVESVRVIGRCSGR